MNYRFIKGNVWFKNVRRINKSKVSKPRKSQYFLHELEIKSDKVRRHFKQLKFAIRFYYNSKLERIIIIADFNS